MSASRCVVLFVRIRAAVVAADQGMLPGNLRMSNHQTAIFASSNTEGQSVNGYDASRSCGLEHEMGG